MDMFSLKLRKPEPQLFTTVGVFFCSRSVQEQRPCADGRTILRYLAQQVVTPYKVHVIAKTLASTS
jgi:hypothetical protein